MCDAPVVPCNGLVATKAVTGGNLSTAVTYTVTLTNTCAGAVLDNPGDEFSDTLPAGLSVAGTAASSGTVSGAGVNPVTWNGAIPSGGSVTITISAVIGAVLPGTPVSNQGVVSFDSGRDGTNDTTLPTDDPGSPSPGDPTIFVVGGQSVVEIPTLSDLGLLVLALALVHLTVRRMRRNRPGEGSGV